MILGIGTDIVEIARIAAIIDKYGEKFLRRFFSDREVAYALSKKNSHEVIAGRFAAKEAISKALGTGFRDDITMRDIEICNDDLGKPAVFFSEKLQSRTVGTTMHISISHEKKMAIAMALWAK